LVGVEHAEVASGTVEQAALSCHAWKKAVEDSARDARSSRTNGECDLRQGMWLVECVTYLVRVFS
jgi:hypothetical protein